jgi:hypothetical protein
VAGLSAAAVERLEHRYGAVREAISGLREARSPASREAIVKFRDFWRTPPQLGEDAIKEECDAVLDCLKGAEDSKPPRPSSGGATESESMPVSSTEDESLAELRVAAILAVGVLYIGLVYLVHRRSRAGSE